MKLFEVIKVEQDPGPHPKTEWGKFLTAFKDYILKELVFDDSYDKQKWLPEIKQKYHDTDVFHDSSVDEIDSAYEDNDVNKVMDAINNALVQQTYEIITSYKSKVNIKSTIDHADALPIPLKDLRKLVEIGCPGFIKWSEQCHKFMMYVHKRDMQEHSATIGHLMQDIRHEIETHFDKAVQKRFEKLQKDARPEEYQAFDGITRGTAKGLENREAMLAWLNEHNKTPAQRKWLYDEMYDWVVQFEDFGRTDDEVGKAAKHAQWHDPEFKKKVFRVIAPYFEKRLKEAHG